MEGSGNQMPAVGSNPAVARREFLVKAAVAGTAAWAIPTIITMEPAGAAELTSPPPTPPEVEIEVEGKTVIDPTPGETVIDPAQVATEPEVEVRGALAVTGAQITTLAGAGAAAIAGGGALHHWSARRERAGSTRPDLSAEPGPLTGPVA